MQIYLENTLSFVIGLFTVSMKILRIVGELNFGGVEKVLKLTIPELIKIQGVKIKILVLSKGGEVSDYFISLGIDVTILNYSAAIPNFQLIYKIWQFCNKFKPDVVHCHGAEANFHGLIGSYLARIPIRIGEEIGMPNHHSYWKFIFKVVYSFSTQIIAVAEKVKNRITEFSEANAEKISILYNPVELSVNSEVKRSGSEFILITVCRLVKIKNLYALIDSVGKIVPKHPFIRLWIVGDGPERLSLENYTEQKGLCEMVCFWGFREDVNSFLSRADIFVLPSFSEGSPVSLAEAMAVGLPSIVTQIGGASEILGSLENGVLIDPFKPNSLTSAIENIITMDDSKRRKMGNNAKIESLKFSIENYLKGLFSIYKF